MTVPRQTRYVVLADLVDSRAIEDRSAFERRLEAALDFINESEGEHIATPLTRMKGIDEFGCVLTRLDPLPDIVCRLLDRIHPTVARFGVASGEIDVGYDNETVAEMDGPAFHRARSLLDTVESNGLFVDIDTGHSTDALVSSALNSLLLARDDLTERQVEVILAYEEHGTQAAAGTHLGVPQQTVSDTLRRANYQQRVAIRERLRQALSENYG